MKIQKLCDEVRQGTPFYVNFKERTIRVGKKIYDINNIEFPNDWSEVSEDVFMTYLTDFYETYKHSVPSERSDSHRKSYFKALPYDKLSDDDILYGAPREFSRFNLEVVFLRGVNTGILHWHDEWGTWFWQSNDDKDFIILRSWVESKD